MSTKKRPPDEAVRERITWTTNSVIPCINNTGLHSKRQIVLLRSVQEQAEILAKTHPMAGVREKHWQIAKTCRDRIFELKWKQKSRGVSK